ncbi:lipocalin family protein [Brevundimonas sp. 2R-24]|uniref:Outer membrane lipoprotein Blc n=1 Tax=Peiella sedimenti TaxID=3061083 RepID=A0ABT8SIY4_9CAUL|nr:lipocalin family protein [Caulobacteraceae bacterium XZ-24]
MSSRQEAYMHRKSPLVPALALVASLALTGCITARGPGGAPPPVPQIDRTRLYTGDWHEIAYRPTWLTRGCVAGITRYGAWTGPNTVEVRDSCRIDTVDGREKAVEGEGRILDPGRDARIRVTYLPFVSRETWVAAVAPDYSWFISVTPDFGELNIFTRDPQISDALRRELTARAEALGYDTSKLYFPPQPER